MAENCLEACAFYTHCVEVAATRAVADHEQTPFGSLEWGDPHNGRTRVFAAKVVAIDLTECAAEVAGSTTGCEARELAAVALTEVAMGFDRYR